MKSLLLASIVFLSVSAHAYIDASPGYVSFSGTEVGSFSMSRTVYVTNRGPEDVPYLSVSGSCFGEFSVQSYSCSGQLARYQSCNITITHRPTREGYSSCSVTIYGGAGGSASISVSGTAVKRRLMPAPKPAERSRK